MNYYKRGVISRSEYEKSMSVLNDRISKKENYSKKLNLSELSKEKESSINAKTIDELMEDLLTPDSLKKLKW